MFFLFRILTKKSQTSIISLSHINTHTHTMLSLSNKCIILECKRVSKETKEKE